MNSQSKPTLYLPSISNLPIPNLAEFKLPPICNYEKPNNTKQFKCNQCQSSFNRKNSLLRHQRIHSGVKPYECQNCLKTFSRKDILTRHKVSLKCQKAKSINKTREKKQAIDINITDRSSSSPSIDKTYEHGKLIYGNHYLENLPYHPLLSNHKHINVREPSPLRLPSTLIAE